VHLSADQVNVQATIALGAGSNGELQVTFPTVNVGFVNFQVAFPSSLSWVGAIVDPLISNFLANEVTSLLRTDGAAEIQKIVDNSANLSLGGTPASFSYAINTIGTDALGLSFDTGANLTMLPAPTFPPCPGSLLSAGGLPTSFSTTSSIVFSVSESFFNRILEQAWQAGVLATTVNPAQLAQKFGTALPIGQTAQDLVNFQPSLQPVVPAQYLTCPIVYRITSLLPPTVAFMPGVPDPLRLRFGEYDITCSIDTGAAPLDVFTVSMYAEIQLGLIIQNGTIAPDMTTLPNPIVSSDLISSPLAPLGAQFIDGYFGSVIPMLFGGIVTQLPPIPVPTLPAGVTLTGATFTADGPNDTYLTIEVNLQ